MTELTAGLAGTARVDVVDTWPVWIQAGAAVITAIGLVCAGIWALVRFRRGRIFMKRCSIDLSCSVTDIHRKTGVIVNVTVTNCGDSRVVFGTTDPAGIEVTSINAESLHVPQHLGWVQWRDQEDYCNEIWENKDWRMRADLLEDCGGRFEPVSLEPGQFLSRSYLFIMPEEWVAARFRCVLAPTTAHSSDPKWLATQVVARPNLDEAHQVSPVSQLSSGKEVA
jgi:hypothetical protein